MMEIYFTSRELLFICLIQLGLLCVHAAPQRSFDERKPFPLAIIPYIVVYE